MTDVFPAAPWMFPLADEAATVRFGARVADWLRPGDFVALTGDLGAGKTTFVRALLRRHASRPELDVPSPTFSLVQLYESGPFPVVHADLYRIETPEELVELGLDEDAEDAVVLVEWADRLGDALPADRLDVAFRLPDPDDDGQRQAEIVGHGRLAGRLRQLWTVERCLEEAGFAGATRRHVTGDASTRAYDRLAAPDGRTAMLMLSPPRADAVVPRYNRPYHHIARLAPDIRPFLAMDQALVEQGLSAPGLLGFDIPAGLAVIEDLGDRSCVGPEGPVAERYGEAVHVLALLHGRTLPRSVPVPGEAAPYEIPPYDLDALLVEVELLLDWFAPQVAGVTVSASTRAGFMSIFGGLLEPLLRQPLTWTLRDYHSPNLIWLPGRTGASRVGLIDFQDCVLGPPAYDLVSLLQDARVTVPDPLEMRLLGAYAQARRTADSGFDMARFSVAYAIMGVQRASKILGIFARLDKRDGKPQYLAHLPRIERYLGKGLGHPMLRDLRGWFETHLPRALPEDGAPE